MLTTHPSTIHVKYALLLRHLQYVGSGTLPFDHGWSILLFP